jgi:hypothetical protein
MELPSTRRRVCHGQHTFPCALEQQPGEYLFRRRLRTSSHPSTRQYARIYRRTKNLRAVQLLLGRTELKSTVRYLGIEVDDAAPKIAERIGIRPKADGAAGVSAGRSGPASGQKRPVEVAIQYQ